MDVSSRKIRKCPACKNEVAVESVVCPICGCNPKRRRIGQVVRWTIVLLACGWLAGHFLIRHTSGQPSSAAHQAQVHA
jgi:hypothetical protein